MRTPTYTNVRHHLTRDQIRRAFTTDASGVTHIRPVRPTYPRAEEASRRSARAYRRHIRRNAWRTIARATVRAAGWATLVASTIVVSVLASTYTTSRIQDRLDTPPAPAYVRSLECPTEDSCLPVWNGHTYDWTPVVP